MGKLDDRVAVITGGSRGIGLATARRFVAEGAQVFITGRDQQQLDAAVEDLGDAVTGVRADSAVRGDIDRLFETVGAATGRLDVLFASAGVGSWIHLDKVTEEEFDRIFDLNAKGTFFTVQKALPLLTDGGSIILMGSISASKGFSQFSVYSASKAAVRSYARTWTTDLKERRIRVNVLSPGTTMAGTMHRLSEKTLVRLAADIPMGRIGQPDEIAAAAAFLASDDASFVTGIELFVDGGTAQV